MFQVFFTTCAYLIIFFFFFRSNTLKSVGMELLSASYTSNVVPIIWAILGDLGESDFG